MGSISYNIINIMSLVNNSIWDEDTHTHIHTHTHTHTYTHAHTHVPTQTKAIVRHQAHWPLVDAC